MVAPANRIRHLEQIELDNLGRWEDELDWEENMKRKQQKQYNPYAPWYVIAWRMVWWVPLKISRELFLLFALLGWGPRVEEELRRITR